MAYDHVQSVEGRRELQRIRRRRSDQRLLLFIAVAAVLGYLAIGLGRAYFYTRNVSEFVSTLDQKSPGEVKKQLHEFARGLSYPNPIIRNASMTALRAATGWRLGHDASEWRKWWADHEATWEYKPLTSRSTTNQTASSEAPAK